MVRSPRIAVCATARAAASSGRGRGPRRGSGSCGRGAGASGRRRAARPSRRSSARRPTWSAPRSASLDAADDPVLTGTLVAGTGRLRPRGRMPRWPTSPPWTTPAPTRWSSAPSSPAPVVVQANPYPAILARCSASSTRTPTAASSPPCTRPATCTTPGRGSATVPTRAASIDVAGRLDGCRRPAEVHGHDRATPPRCCSSRPGNQPSRRREAQRDRRRRRSLAAQGPPGAGSVRGPGRRHRRRPQPRLPRSDARR